MALKRRREDEEKTKRKRRRPRKKNKGKEKKKRKYPQIRGFDCGALYNVDTLTRRCVDVRDAAGEDEGRGRRESALQQTRACRCLS